ncbi:MAG: DNA-directed RNA polymerase subunit omega [Saprospiraceae bacterium]|nr:DNA-directed RNA polymerase subunit omega [Saprospiraceae bacterium]
MTDIKSQVQGYNSYAKARDISKLVQHTGNIYETLAIISKRANQLNVEIKHELSEKLEEFAISTDTIEEVHENKEQIEISKFYERLPNAALIATEEYLSGSINYRYRNDDKMQEGDEERLTTEFNLG